MKLWSGDVICAEDVDNAIALNVLPAMMGPLIYGVWLMATKSSSSHQGAKNTRRLVTIQDVNKYTYYTNNNKCQLFVSFKS